MREGYEGILILVPEGTKERIKKATDESVTEFITRLIQEDLKRRGFRQS